MMIGEREIRDKLYAWLKEGERLFDDPALNAKIKKHPNTLHGTMQRIGWVRRDLRVALDKSKAKKRSITIGKYIIAEAFSGDKNGIAISMYDGEGGEFNKAKFEAVIEKFYNDNF